MHTVQGFGIVNKAEIEIFLDSLDFLLFLKDISLDKGFWVGSLQFQKNIYFCFIDYAKAFDCVDHNKLWKILKVMGIPDHLTCLLRNL